MNLTVFSVVTVQSSATAEYFKSFFLAGHTLPNRPESVWQKMTQYPLNGTTQPVDTDEEG